MDRECQDPEQRRQLMALIACDQSPGDPIAAAVDSLWCAVKSDEPGSTPRRPTEDDDLAQMGPYRLLEKTGQGGLGAVYLAERADGQFQRQVAVKVVRRDLVSQRLLDDLRLERQIMARLEHPNIARLYDGGTGPGGQPFLAMEFVDGLPIDRYCQPLTLRQRLDLFLDVCSAVAYAHRNLVIHRDIKTSNILVTAEGTPKLLDFGIAEPVITEASEPGATKRPRRRPFTPDYASPEQAAGESLTTATDVYSLGVVLYRLISDQPPYRFRPEARLDEIVGALNDSPVRAPSEAARQAGSGIWKKLRGDLDAIVTKAMSRRPQQRYGSVQELADDLRHYLQDRPVMARAATRTYRATRFLRRHRLAVTASALILTTLALGWIVTTWSLGRAQTAQKTAESRLIDLSREQRRAQRMIDSFVDTFRLADPGEARGKTISVRELIDRSVESMPTSRETDPELDARLSLTFGQVYLNLGSPAKAQELFEQSLAVAEPHLEPNQLVLWQARARAAEALIDQGQFGRAAEQLVRHIESYRRDLGQDGIGMAQLVHTLGVARLHQGDPIAAAALFRRAISLQKNDLHQDELDADKLPGAGATAGGDPLALAESEHRLAQALLRSGDLATAERLLQKVLSFRRQRLGDTHPTTTTASSDLAALALYRGQDRQAADLFGRVLEHHRAVFGTNHPHVAVALQNLATAEKRLGLLDSAKDHLLEAVAVRRRVHGPTHPAVADALYALGRFVHQRSDFDEAELIYRQVLEMRRQLLGEKHPQVAMALLGLADLEWSRGRMAPAERLYRRVIEQLETLGQDQTVDATFPYFQLGSVLLRTQRRDEACRWLARAHELRQQTLGADHRATVAARAKLSECREQAQ